MTTSIGTRLAYVLLCASAFAALARAADDVPAIRTNKIAPGVYMFDNFGNNILASIGDDAVVLVDASFPRVAERIVTELRGLSDKPIRFVINTHVHDDHTAGNAVLQRSAPAIAHRNVRVRMEKGDEKLPPEAFPLITYDTELTLRLNGEEIRLLKVPDGHTDGDTVVFFVKANVIHMGDVFMPPAASFQDHGNGGTILGLIDALEFVLPQIPADARIVPGHGPVSTRADVVRGLEALKEMRATVESAMRAGKTAEQLIAEKALDRWRPLVPPFMTSMDGYIKRFYRELAATPSPQS